MPSLFLTMEGLLSLDQNIRISYVTGALFTCTQRGYFPLSDKSEMNLRPKKLHFVLAISSGYDSMPGIGQTFTPVPLWRRTISSATGFRLAGLGHGLGIRP